MEIEQQGGETRKSRSEEIYKKKNKRRSLGAREDSRLPLAGRPGNATAVLELFLEVLAEGARVSEGFETYRTDVRPLAAV